MPDIATGTFLSHTTTSNATVVMFEEEEESPFKYQDSIPFFVIPNLGDFLNGLYM
jgi:hypothetical protein